MYPEKTRGGWERAAVSYLDLVVSLPLPTPEQTARCAVHVAENHSWYKHLPYFPPGATFVFFLNPAAGQAVREAGGVVRAGHRAR